MSYSELANPRATRAILEEFGHDPKYKLGQNFLVDDNVIGRILDLAGFDPNEDQAASDGLPSIVEIGPGIGTLTVALLKHAQVVSVEQDRDLPAILAETTALNSDRFALVQGDALKTTREEIESACSRIGAELPSQLVSNLPYQVAATVILGWFENFDFLKSMTVMVQSEVADRIAAEVGTKNYGAYTVKLALRAQVTDRFQVPPSCFMPAPHVESAVIHLERKDTLPADEVLAASRVAEAAFAQRRKNIRNSMKTAFDKGTVDALLESAEVAPTTRGETLSPETYLEMGRALLSIEC